MHRYFFEFALLSAWKYLFIYLEIFMFFTSFSFQVKQKISDDVGKLTQFINTSH